MLNKKLRIRIRVFIKDRHYAWIYHSNISIIIAFYIERKEKNIPSRIGNLQLKRKRFFLNIYRNRILIIDWPDFVADADGQRFLANYFWLSSLGLINLVSYFWEYNKLCFEVNHLSLLYCLWLYCMKNSKLLWRLQLPDFSKSTSSPALVSIFVYLLRN